MWLQLRVEPPRHESSSLLVDSPGGKGRLERLAIQYNLHARFVLFTHSYSFEGWRSRAGLRVYEKSGAAVRCMCDLSIADAPEIPRCHHVPLT